MKLKKFFSNLGACFTVLIFSINTAYANVQSELQQRLSKLQNLTADYQQQLKNPAGKVMQQGSGKIQLKRPNLYLVESQTPQENIIVSDGKTTWFYDPFVEQVTARNSQSLLINTPFVLLTSTNPGQWQNYYLSQQGNQFVLIPKSRKSMIKKFMLEITADGKLLSFATTEKSGQQNIYRLSKQNYVNLKNSVFDFKMPVGATLDDQRK